MQAIKTDKIWNKNFIFLIISLICVASAHNFFTATIAEYANITGQNSEYSGFLPSVFFLGAFGMRFINGIMVQKYGAYSMMLLGIILCVISCFSLSFCGIWLMLAFRMLHGAGYSVFTTAAGTAASFFIPKERISEGIGYFATGYAISMSIGPAISLIIVSSHTVQSYHTLFAAAGIITLLSFLFINFIKKSTGSVCGEPVKIKYDFSKKHLPKTFMGFEKGIIYPAVVDILMFSTITPAVFYLMGYGIEKGWNNVSTAFAIYSAGLIFVRTFIGRLSDKYGSDIAMFPAFVFSITALTGIAFCNSYTVLCVLMLCLGTSVGIYNPQLNVFFIKRCTKYRRGTATAACQGSCDFGFAAGGILYGFIIHHFGYFTAYITAATVCFFVCIFYILTLSKFAEDK